MNDVLLSDFYTPQFFDPVQAVGVRYSFTGALIRPREILRGGYISWHNPIDNHWYEQAWFSGPKPKVRDLGVFAASSMSTREWIDRQTHDSRRMKKEAKAKPAKKATMTALVAGAGTPRAAAGRASMLQQQIDRLLS